MDLYAVKSNQSVLIHVTPGIISNQIRICVTLGKAEAWTVWNYNGGSFISIFSLSSVFENCL